MGEKWVLSAGSNPALATYHPKVEQYWHRVLIKGWNGVILARWRNVDAQLKIEDSAMLVSG
jgi:hypothetical protein